MNEKYPCPHGKKEGALVICSAPAEETKASREWMNAEKTGIIVTPWYCALTCPMQTPKPELPRE